MDRRDFKTNPQQWNLVMDFVEEHPMLVKPNLISSEEDHSIKAILWEELTGLLNSMGFGERSVEKWKAAIGRWRSKTKAKASLIRKEAEKSDGGLSKAVSLTDTEERLLELIGWRSRVTGYGNGGLRMGPNIKRKSPPQPLPSNSSVFFPSISGMSNGSPLREEPMVSTATSPPPLAPLSTRVGGRKRTRWSPDKSRKRVTANQVRQETLKELRDIRQSVAIMANAHREIADDIKRLVNFMIDRE